MKINYMMTKNFRKEWGVVDAVRELVQNCMDYVPMSFPAWIDPETNLISVPDNFLEQLEDLCI